MLYGLIKIVYKNICLFVVPQKLLPRQRLNSPFVLQFTTYSFSTICQLKLYKNKRYKYAIS